MSSPLLLSFVAVNILAFVLMGWDKLMAKGSFRRTSERTLLLVALFGGGVGASFGMSLFRHKTLHKKFSVGLPVIAGIQILLLAFFITRLS